MKRFFFLQMIWLLFLCACASIKPIETSTPISQPSPQVVEMTALTATPLSTATPQPTSSPPPQPELTYTISLSEQQKGNIHVKLLANNITGKQFVLTFWTNAANWDEWINPANNVSNLLARSANGAPLTTRWGDDGISWTGKHGLWIDSNGQNDIILEYDVKLGFVDENFDGSGQQLLGGYLSNSFGFAEPEFIFLAPNDIESRTYKMKVVFDLPDEWQTVTHWTKLKENEYEVSTEIGQGNYSSIEFANGAIAFGNIYKEEYVIGNTIVNVGVVGYPDSVAEKLAALTAKNFEYYTTLLGPTPAKGYIMVFVPPTVDGRYTNPYNENIGGCFTRIYVTDNLWNTSELWWVNISHPMFHNWIGGFSGGEFWYLEGFTSYYELKALKVLGINNSSVVDPEISRRFKRYQQEILGSPNDYSLQQASISYQSNHGFPYDFITYKKGSLFAYLLDQEITRRTDGNKTLDDVMHYLFQDGTNVDSQQLLDGVSAVTGEDFSQLLNDYLLDNKPLPLVQNGNVIFVDIEKLSP